MNLKLKITVLPNDPASISWSGSAGDKLKLTKMKIQDRLQYLAGNADIVYKTSAWNTIKDKAKAEILIKSGLGLVQNAKYVEAIQSFNHAIRITPKVCSHFLLCCVLIRFFKQDDSDSLGRIHAGRSLASFKLEQLSESYDDCVMAMEHLPQRLTVHRVKVLERMVCCKPDSAKGILKKIR